VYQEELQAAQNSKNIAGVLGELLDLSVLSLVPSASN
jgi:hypothetical protein